MRAYIIRRLLLLIPTLFFLTILVFLALRFIPGDVIDAMIGIGGGYFGGDHDTREALMRALGLDVPLHVQYVRWVGGMVLHGTLGSSLYGDALTIEEQILRRLPVTLELGLLAIVIGLVIALPVGIYSAIRRNTAADYAGPHRGDRRIGHAQLLAGGDGYRVSGDLVELDAAGADDRPVR